MSFKTDYPDFAAIESQVRNVRAERALAMSQVLVGCGEAIVRGVRKVRAMFAAGGAAESDRRAIEADAFLKRSVPKY